MPTIFAGLDRPVSDCLKALLLKFSQKETLQQTFFKRSQI